jgi:LysM repeat protein
VKAIVIILLALGIFGGAYYATWFLYLQPQAQIQQEKQSPPPPPPPDPALPEFQRVLTLQESGDINGARTAWQDFVERYPQSSKINEAKDRLGQINISLFLSPVQTPEKTLYIVKPGDVINKVAARNKSTSELLMRANNLQPNAKNIVILRIGQKLLIPPADFSLVINRGNRKVELRQGEKFFRHYSILTMPAHLEAAAKKKAPPKNQKITGKVTEKIAWNDKTRVIFTDKAYAEADHWILISPGGNNLYTDVADAPADPANPSASQPHKPPGGGYGLAAESMRELATMLRKGDAVTIE